MWLAMAVATLWMLTVGSDLEQAQENADVTSVELPELSLIPDHRPASRPRALGLFRLGWLWLLVQLIQGQPLPLPRRLVPEPWPEVPERLEVVLSHEKALSYTSM
jgi:hypothetical protein